ncbi:hypothetical protein [Flagellimonas beolgyonensis]|uniref:hypothetical protein n=1 Tax=Flagellimonas beolgyonensis TaxID=864064 RepID=UPI000F8D4A66|nr:hypothetical protein [Allomuricauda beolgyonensis]
MVDLGEAVLFGNIWATRRFIIEDKTEQYVQQYFSVFFFAMAPVPKSYPRSLSIPSPATTWAIADFNSFC